MHGRERKLSSFGELNPATSQDDRAVVPPFRRNCKLPSEGIIHARPLVEHDVE